MFSIFLIIKRRYIIQLLKYRLNDYIYLFKAMIEIEIENSFILT